MSIGTEIAQQPAGLSRRALTVSVLLLVVAAFALYARNLDDYFVGDDFDLIMSFQGEPPSYFFELLFSNESNRIWGDLGLDDDLGGGYIRPLKIWLLKLDNVIWGTNPIGYHVAATAFFALDVVMSFLILALLIPRRPAWAFVGAALVLLQPAFGQIVPWITAREETMVLGFGLLSVYAFLRYRLYGSSAFWFHFWYVMALLTKEWGTMFLGIALGYDLAHGRFFRRGRAVWREHLSTYAPSVVILAVYMGMRWVAFGNFMGGEMRGGSPFSLGKFLAVPGETLELLLSPYHNALELLTPTRVTGGLAALIAVVLLRRRALRPGYLSDLLAIGPIWCLGWTILSAGTYLSVRHMPIGLVGMTLFVVLLLAGAVRGLPRAVEWATMLATIALAAFAFIPPTLRASRELEGASRTVHALRAKIEAATLELPDGSSVLLEGVPQLEWHPYYFGWALQSILSAPFTPSDAARRLKIINFRNIEMNAYNFEIPESFDLHLSIERGGRR